MADKIERPKIPTEEIIEVNNSKPIDFQKPYRFIYTQWWFLLISIFFTALVAFLLWLASIFYYG